MAIRWEPSGVPTSLWKGGNAKLVGDSISVGAEPDAEQASNRAKAINGRFRAAENADPTEDVSLQPLLNSLRDLKGSGLSTRMLEEPLPAWNALRERLELRAAANPSDSAAARTAMDCLETMMRGRGSDNYYSGWDDFMEWRP